MTAIVVMPTYNERENLLPIAARLRAAAPEIELLVVDDGSPDGTGELADELSAADPRVHVLHRTRKDGLGAAYRAGMGWAMARGYDVVVEMDADGSHRPEQLPALLHALERADVVVGSRWVAGGSITGWPRHRAVISRVGSSYARHALGLRVRDVTGGYRAFRTGVLRLIEVERLTTRGYCFQIDLLRRASDEGMRIAEVPIAFAERERGRSKMSTGIVIEAAARVSDWGLHRMLQQLSSGGRRLVPAGAAGAAVR